MGNNWLLSIKVIVAIFVASLIILSIYKYKEFKHFESFENETIEISDQLFGNINKQDININRVKLISICNERFASKFIEFSDLKKLTDEQWELLTTDKDISNTLMLSMVNAETEMKNYSLALAFFC